jgi:hypothetical protein
MMRIHVLLAVVMILGCSSSYAESVSEHKDTEELMQYMEANKALDFVKQRFMFLARAMRKTGLDENEMTKDELAKEQDNFRKLEELINKEITWEKVKTSFAIVFEEVFTESERADLLKFFRSPTGIAYRKKFPELTLKLMEAGQGSFAYIMPALEKLGEEEIKSKDMKKQDKK